MSRLDSLPTASVLGDVADLVSAIVWPAVVIGVVWFLRDPVRALADRVSTSAEGLTVGAQGLSIQLGTAVTHVPAQAETALAGVRQPDPAPAVVDSAAMTMFNQLNLEAPAPYLAVDLGTGREWLTSRLFIFAILLQAMRRTQVLVFLETAGTVRTRFVGLATCDRVRWSLAHQYPWLEQAFARAYETAVTAPPPAGEDPTVVVDNRGRLKPWIAHRIATEFVFAVQEQPPAAAAAPPPPAGPSQPPPADWVIEQRSGGAIFAEHASWLSGADLERLLGDALHRFAYVREDTPGEPADRAWAALRVTDEDVVALVDDEHRFRELVVDRREALEAVAADAIRPEPEDDASAQS